MSGAMSGAVSGTVIVTGGTGGIGQAICEQVAACGFRVIVGYASSRGAAEELAGTLPGSAVACKIDHRETLAGSEIEALVADEPVFGLVNNAALRNDGLFLECTEASWEDSLRVNVVGPASLAQLVLPGMLSRRAGWIVNISSGVARLGSPGQSHYSASKGALEALTRTLAQEVRRRKVGVVAVSPGPVLTRMTGSLTEAQWDGILAAVPLGRAAQPEEIAYVVGQVLIRNVLSLSGSIITVDGGTSAVKSFIAKEPA